MKPIPAIDQSHVSQSCRLWHAVLHWVALATQFKGWMKGSINMFNKHCPHLDWRDWLVFYHRAIKPVPRVKAPSSLIANRAASDHSSGFTGASSTSPGAFTANLWFCKVQHSCNNTQQGPHLLFLSFFSAAPPLAPCPSCSIWCTDLLKYSGRTIPSYYLHIKHGYTVPEGSLLCSCTVHVSNEKLRTLLWLD